MSTKTVLKILALLFLVSIIAATCNAQSDTATVEKVEGVYIYVFSRPVQAYEVLGSFTVKQRWTGEPKEQLRTALDKLRKEYPGAQALLFTGGNMQQAQAVKFK